MDELIVADSSPLISFARAGKLQIIYMVYAKIIVPSAVYKEVVVMGKGKPGAEEIGMADWIEIQVGFSLQYKSLLIDVINDFRPL